MIFISHSSKDHDAATALHARLLAGDYDPSQLFLDSDVDSGIAAGEPWQQALYTRLKDCRALIVLCTQNWLDSKWCFAELIYAKASGKEIFPVILEPCDFRGALDEHQAVLVYRDGDAAYERLWRALDTRHLGPRDDFGWPPKDGDACPFPGLLSFDERYAGVYFGREPETQAVLEELRKMRANGEPRLLMITGGSGSGKSSLLKAGVLPQLTHKSSGTEWLVLPVMRYGQAASPQHTVLDQLAMNVAQPDWKVLRDAFSGPDGAKAFVDATRDLAVARGSPGATVLLPVDQFEELLVPAAGPDAGAFLRFLHEIFGCANGRLLAVGTMRSDHLDVYERHPHALAAPYFQPWRLGPFPRDRVRDVIVKPAARAGVEVTPDLLARLERDTPSSESLPLLAFTLEKLYRRYAADRKLELQEYEDLGGMEGAIQKSADAIALAPEVLDAVRLTFVKHLASFNDKDEAVRVPARWSDIPDAAKPALERFVADRLLVKNDHDDAGERWVRVEVAHEALFRAWPALKQWLADAADILRWRRDVQRDRVADPHWRALRPSQLAVARPWLRHRRSELTDAEVGWIRRSIRRERAQWAFAALVAALILGFGIYAFVQKRAADRVSQVSLGRFLASQSLDVATTRPRNCGQALLLAIEGYRRAPAAVTAAPLRTLMAETPLPIARLKHDGPVHAAAFSPDGRWLATGDETGKIRVWDFRTKTQLAAIDRHHRINALFWSLDGERVVASAEKTQQRPGQEELVFWNWRMKDAQVVVSAPKLTRLLSSRDPERWLIQLAPSEIEFWGKAASVSVAMDLKPWGPTATTPTGDRLAIAVQDGKAYRVHVVETTTGRTVGAPFVVREARPSALAFRPDGGALAIGTSDGLTRVWDWQTNTVRATHEGSSDPSQLVFSPDGKLVAEIDSSLAFTLRVWNAATGEDIDDLDAGVEEGRRLNWVRFTEDGRHLIACLGDSAIRVFYIPSEDTVLPVLRFTPQATVMRVDMDRTGTFAAVGSLDHWVTVWKLEPGHSVQHFANTTAVVPAPHGGAVAFLGPAGGRIIDERLRQAPLHLGPVDDSGVAVFSDDGRRFACEVDEDRILFADLAARTTRLLGRESATPGMRFSPDGKRLLVVQEDARLASIDVATGHESMLFRTRGLESNAFSPDGRFFAEAASDRPGHLYDVAQKKELGEIAVKGAFIPTLTFDATSTLLAIHAVDGVSVWSTASLAHVLTIPVQQRTDPTVVFDASGRHIAVADGPEIHVYDTRGKKKRWTLPQIGGDIETLSFSPDGVYLAAGCEDKNVRIWRMADGEAVMAIPQEHSFSFHGDGGTVGFTPGGKYLIVTQGCDECPYGNFARFILWRPEDVLREACRRSLRKALTTAEWQQFLNGQPYRETCSEEVLNAASH